MQIGWNRPANGRLKVNSDGTVSSSNMSTFSGGLMRDDCGNSLVEFARNVGICLALHAAMKNPLFP